MNSFNVPTRETVNSTNQEIFAQLVTTIGFLPNLFATFAYSDNALKNYLAFSNAPNSLKAKEKEVVNLAVSQVNNCNYCLSAHTAIAKMNGFTEAQIFELRSGRASFDSKLNTLARLARVMTERRGQMDNETLEKFFASGWTKENLVDTISLIGDKTISNYLHNTTQVPIDFPKVKPLQATLKPL